VINSTVSAAIANFFMEDVEQGAVKLNKRYLREPVRRLVVTYSNRQGENVL
jgi:hypothetical protein